jgi:DNA-binding NarL/FixJ family response regulator
MTGSALRLVIADDHYLVREGTRRLLESTGQVDVVATVTDAPALLAAVGHLKPDVAVVDIRMPPTHQTEGIQAARTIRATHPGVGVVVLSQYANALYAFELFQEGTDGLAYLLKDRVGDLDELVRAVTTVAEGGSVIDPQVVEGLLARGATVPDTPIPRLTDRETEVLHAMAQGKSNQAIAETMYLSESAVEKHISAVFAKLGLDPDDGSVNRRVAAVLRFLRAS